MATETEFFGRTIPTLEEQRATRARVVRDALRALSDEPMCGKMFALLAKWASDTALDKLGRMLK